MGLALKEYMLRELVNYTGGCLKMTVSAVAKLSFSNRTELGCWC
jgi:hypothetical protein